LIQYFSEEVNLKSVLASFFLSKRSFFACFTLFLILIISPACNFVAPDETKAPDLNQTQVALSVQQTLTAKESSGANATIAAQQATIQAQAALATAQSGQPPPQPPQQPTQEVAVQPTPEQPQQPPPPPPQQPTASNIDEQMKNAEILLYEDMVSEPSEYRYVKRTLDAMDLRYKDDGNAQGWLKSDLLGNSPSGKPWDLVIIANEARSEVTGEYYDYIDDVLDKGTPVILESWILDSVSQGKVSPILAKCGVQVYPYFPESLSVNDVLLWPIPSTSQHPIMNDPNGGMTFTRARDTWLSSMDLGSLMALTGGGDAIFLLGHDAQSESQDGALAVCMKGHLILQTFSSHSFEWDTMYPLWENYITNALRVRFSGG
jgi:hypothetical protein